MMSKNVRSLILVCATTASLVVAGNALAAFTPTMAVSAKPARPGASGVASLRFTVPRDDDALARVQFFVPAGYTATLGQAIGTELGAIAAQVRVREPIEGAVVPVNGTIRVADPSAALPQTPSLTVRSSAALCTGTPTHAAFWVIALSAAGNDVHVPVAVDPAPAPVSAFASHIMTICLSNPNIPAAIGGAPLGLKLINAHLTIRGVFTTPSAAGDVVWRAIATPWGPGAGPPVAVNTREARAHLRLPASLTVTTSAGRKVRGFRTITVSGAVREQTSGVAGATVRVTVGRVTRTVRAGATGAYRATFRLRAGRRYAATVRATVAQRTAPSPCSTPGPFQASTPAVPCATETLAYFDVAPDGAPATDTTALTAARAFRVR
jgi:hypothetical protein